MMVGAFGWGRVADSFGRRPTLIATALTISCFGILTSAAWSYAILITCRFFVGIGIAGVPTAFSLIMEFTPSSYRGKVGLYLQMAWTVGTVIQALLAWIILPTYGWRVLVFVSALPSVLSICLFLSLPESPRYLCATGQLHRAQKVLDDVASFNKTSLPPGHLEGVKESVSDTKADERKTASTIAVICDMFNGPLAFDTLKLFLIWFSTAFVYYGLILFTTVTASGGGKTV